MGNSSPSFKGVGNTLQIIQSQFYLTKNSSYRGSHSAGALATKSFSIL